MELNPPVKYTIQSVPFPQKWKSTENLSDFMTIDTATLLVDRSYPFGGVILAKWKGNGKVYPLFLFLVR